MQLEIYIFYSFKNFTTLQWEVCILSILHVIQWEFETEEPLGGMNGHTDRRTDRQTYKQKDIQLKTFLTKPKGT